LYANFDDPKCPLNLVARYTELFERYSSGVHGDLPNFLSEEYRGELDVLVKQTRGVHLDNFIDSKICKRRLSDAFDGPLDRHTQEMTDKAHKLVLVAISELVQPLCEGLPRLRGFIIGIAEELLQERKSEVSNTLDIILAAEKHQMFTQNHYYMDTITRIRKDSSMPATRTNPTTGKPEYTPVSVTGEGMKEFIKTSREEFAKGESNHDQALTEMQVTLHVYAKVLKKRVFDEFPLIVKDGSFRVLTEMLYKKLVIVRANSDDLKRAMRQDPETTRKRERKTKTMSDLNAALEDFKILRC